MSSLAEKHFFIGKYVVVRTYAAGVHIGLLKDHDEKNRQCLLEKTRRLWSWSGAFTLSEVSELGIKDGKLSIEKPLNLIFQVEEILPCSYEAERILREFKVFNS